MFKPVSPRVDFPALERDILKFWYEKGIVKKYLNKNKNSKKKFSFLDGPITANNPMGVHHAWGRTYKDLWQRFWNMRGYKQRFQNGFDEQGLWVEVEVEKELGLRNKKDIENLVPGDKFKSLEKFINLCKERVKKYAGIQTDQSKRLGYFMDWDNSYHTSSDENNYWIWHFLKKVSEKGWLYKGRDSVPWCPRCGTAISQHEILTEEYKEITHRTVVFKLRIHNRENEYLLAWTTTPWTIPGNVALAVDPNLTYWKMKNEEGEVIYIVDPSGSKEIARDEMLVNKYSLVEGFTKVSEVKGKELVGLTYDAPFDDLPIVKKALGNYIHRVVPSDPLILPINPAEGTGIVHVAPGAGGEDFRLGKKEKLPVIAEIDEGGIFIQGFDFISGQHVKKASPLIVENLKSRGLLHREFDYLHRYPTCWRCKEELVWRVVDEWYIGMDKKDKSGKTYRQQMVEVAKKISWMPSWGLERELDWLSNMHDWLISKKRYWGLALPIWECHKCGSFEVIGSKEELKKRAIEGFDKFKGHSPHRPWIDEIKIKCSSCRTIISRIPDVGNPWLDAGIVPFSTLPKDWFPAEFITESFPGQFKNWFYALIAESTALKNTNPFKRVLGFASVLGEDGRPMHKSWGNSIEFNEGADKIGVDVMRWMYVTQDPEQNLLFGYHKADEMRRRFHLILWNVYNFFVTYAKADNFKPKKSSAISKHILDRWVLSRLNRTIEAVTKLMEEYNAKDASLAIEEFVSDLSLWYVRRSRNRVGPAAEDKKDKENSYYTLFNILINLSKLLAPFTPFVSDEIYKNLTRGDSVHIEDWPAVNKKCINEKLEDEIFVARTVVEQGHSKRKEANIKVRQPLGLLELKLPALLSEEVITLISDELNVKKIKQTKGKDVKLTLDTKITAELKAEGEARDIVRMIQEERKKLGTSPSEKVNVQLEDWPKEFEEYIKRKALIENLSKGEFNVLKHGENNFS